MGLLIGTVPSPTQRFPCKATVKQHGVSFIPNGIDFIHPWKTNDENIVHIKSKIFTKAAAEFFTPVSQIVTDVL